MSKHVALAVTISEAYGNLSEQENTLSALFMEKFHDMAKQLREVDESADFTDHEAECMDAGVMIAEDLLHSSNFATDRKIVITQPDQSAISIELLIDRILTCAKDLRAEMSA